MRIVDSHLWRIQLRVFPHQERIAGLTIVLVLSIAPTVVAAAAESWETAPIRPDGGQYVPPPFTPLTLAANAVNCLGRAYDLTAAVPVPTVAGRPLLLEAAFTLDGIPLTPPTPTWTVKTPAVAVAERTWLAGPVRLTLRQTIEYDGFVTSDLTLAPVEDVARISELALRLKHRPEASVLYQIPMFSKTWAGFWPKEMKIEMLIVGVWGGDDAAGFATYVATFRDWRGSGPRVVLTKDEDGTGSILYRITSEATKLEKPVTYRFGFIATPVRPPEARHWQLFSMPPGKDELTSAVSRLLIWGALSDHYATFRTNKPDRDADKLALVKSIKETGKAALAYTTYAHVEEGAVETPAVWGLANAKGKAMSASIGGAMANLNRVFCCPGSREWVELKLEDLKAAIERYGVDGFYVDTSYIILPCANALHGHGWVDGQGAPQADFLTWSMREIWRRAYETVCQAWGKADIYAHHKGGCPPALAAFTTAFCDGEQFTGQSIKNLTLDAFRAQISGRNIGPLALFLNEYYRSALYRMRERSQHPNPAESVMLPLLHDVLPTSCPGHHPVEELIALRNDLGITDAAWLPYYAPNTPWRVEGASGAVVSAYRTAQGDTLLVVGNPTYEPIRGRLDGPSEAIQNRTFVAIDVLSRMGRGSPTTPGYRWEPAEASRIEVPARSFGLFAFVRQPDARPVFAPQRGFVASAAAKPRRTPTPEGALLVDDFEDLDWTLANDDGALLPNTREPVDTAQAMRVNPKPQHASAALLRPFAEPQNWTRFAALSFWIRPERHLPVKALDVRLRNEHQYGPAMKLVSHDPATVLPPGRWTELRYEFDSAPRGLVHILRIYHNRGGLCSGPFDLDEALLWSASATTPAKTPSAAPAAPDKAEVPD